MTTSKNTQAPGADADPATHRYGVEVQPDEVSDSQITWFATPDEAEAHTFQNRTAYRITPHERIPIDETTLEKDIAELLDGLSARQRADRPIRRPQ